MHAGAESRVDSNLVSSNVRSGQKQTFTHLRRMSVLLPKAIIANLNSEIRRIICNAKLA